MRAQGKLPRVVKDMVIDHPQTTDQVPPCGVALSESDDGWPLLTYFSGTTLAHDGHEFTYTSSIKQMDVLNNRAMALLDDGSVMVND